jgi:choline dehydrogenase
MLITDVRDSPYVSDVPKMFVKSAAAAGVPETDDYNGRSQFGVRLSELSVAPNGERCTTFQGYIRNTGALSRPNLTVATCVHVTRLLWAGKHCVGVQ